MGPSDPLAQPDILARLKDSGADFGYMATRMIAIDMGERARRLAENLHDTAWRDTITGLALATYGLSAQSDTALLRATAIARSTWIWLSTKPLN